MLRWSIFLSSKIPAILVTLHTNNRLQVEGFHPKKDSPSCYTLAEIYYRLELQSSNMRFTPLICSSVYILRDRESGEGGEIEWREWRGRGERVEREGR